MDKRIQIDLHLPNAPTRGPAKPPTIGDFKVQMVIILGRRGMPPELSSPGHEGPLVLAYDTAFEFLDLLTKFMNHQQGTAELVPFEHFLVAAPFDQTRARVHLQYNVALVPAGHQTPAFIVPFEELAREIILFAIGVYENVLESCPNSEDDLAPLSVAIEETKDAVEQFLKIENLLNFPAEDEIKEK